MFEDCSFWDQIEEFEWNEKILVKPPTQCLDISFASSISEQDESLHGQADCPLPFAKSKLYSIPIKEAKVLVDSNERNDKKIIEMVFDIKDISIEFLPGDTIGIIPENSEEDVNSIINILGLVQVADNCCNISIKPEVAGKRVKIPPHIPRNSTLRNILKDCVSFTFPPKKQFFRVLYEYSTEEHDKRILGALCSRDSKYFNEALKIKFNIVKALTYFSSCRPPITVLLENLPRLLPRPYSISNSQLVNKDEIRIVFSVLNSNPGLTTKLLESHTYKLLENTCQQSVNLYLRERNSFTYSEEEFAKNLIMISVGCAISPFIGFMQHKEELCNINYQAKTWLFTGFRDQNVALYRNEIRSFLKKGIIDAVFESFSRDSSCKNKYVQDCINENSEEFVNLLLKPDTILYVCADGAEISKDIQETIENCIAKSTNCDLAEAKELLISFKKTSKYREDIWT